MIWYRLTLVKVDGSVVHTPEMSSFDELTAHMNDRMTVKEAQDFVKSNLGSTPNLQWWIDRGWQLEWANIEWKMVDPDYGVDNAIESLKKVAGL